MANLEREGWLPLAIPLLWARAAVPYSFLSWPVFFAFVLVILASPVAAALVLATSGFFFATMNLGSSQIYLLRGLCIASFLIWWIFILRGPLSRRTIGWIAVVAALLFMGAIVTTASLGVPAGEVRPSHVEALVAVIWVMSIAVGWGLVRGRGGCLRDSDIFVIVAAWMVAIGYGVAQSVFGFGPANVPAEIMMQIEGFRQYEDLGRRPFASLTANGMAVVSLFPLVILLLRCRAGLAGVLAAAFLGGIVGLLTLTRSYLVLVALLVLLVPLVRGSTSMAWVIPALMAAGGVLMAAFFADSGVLSLALRLEGDISSLRGQIWSFTLEHMDPWDWLTGMGFGSAVWRAFLAPLSVDKDLSSPHTALLEVAGQFGLIGAALYLVIGWSMLRTAWRLRLYPLFAAPAVAGMLVLTREQVAASYVFSPSMLAANFWFIFGMALAAGDRVLPGPRIAAAAVPGEVST